MGKIQQNNLASVVLDHHQSTAGLWSSCRRKIINTMRCGGGGYRHHHHHRHTVQSQVVGKKPECRSDVNEKNNENLKNNDNVKNKKSDKLSELLRMSELYEEEEEAVKKKVENLEELKAVVKRLQCGGNDDVLGGAKDVRKLAKEDSDVRTMLALLGAIPPLVGMLDSEDLDSQIAALYALLNLGIGNDTNKAAIVKAGAVHKMLDLINLPNEGVPNPDVSAAIVANFLGLTALDSNKPIIGSSGAISFLVETLKISTEGKANSQVVQDCLRALYNLSILPSNVLPMIEIDDFVSFLLTTLGDMEVSDRILSILSNVVSTPEGRKALSSFQDSFQILVDVLSWTDSPSCQEQATYILMVMTHKSYRDRQAMIESGVSSSLLELTLLGSTLAQKRASRILEILRIDKGKQVSETFIGTIGSNVSAPLYGSTDSMSMRSADPSKVTEDERMMSDENKAVKHLVQQSLHSNMRRIVKRANLPQDFVPSEHFRSLTSISTSKSLPF
ncbi:U-box domain-containing protein 45-like [Rutidosis leptorrhynchoides]|uniref:U-box domain-containing protein 45-like n=1 Tax=Rutidosis leptorrhynchoides TaxID=125765 RepID=UPI003A9A5CC1